MNNPSKDIRYAQTEEDLLTAFDLLCREKDPAKITVAEISKKTGVTRSTFYNHYQDMLQLIETLEDRILNDLRGVLVMLQPGSEQPEKLTRTYFSALCRYVKKSGFLIRQLKTLEGAEFVGRAMSPPVSSSSLTFSRTRSAVFSVYYTNGPPKNAMTPRRP